MTAIEWVYQNSTHTGSVYHVLVTLAIAYGVAGCVCLSVKEIADRTKVSQTTVRRALEALTQDGTISVVKNGGSKRKHGATNCYRMNDYETSLAEIRGTQRDTPNGVHNVEGVHNVTPQNEIRGTQRDTPSDSQLTPESPVEYAPAHTDKGPLNKTTKTTTTTVAVVVPETLNPPNNDGIPLSEQVGDMGDVARAYDKYIRGTMTGQSADIFGVMIEDFSAAKVVEAFKASFGKKDPWGYAIWWLKHPELVEKSKPIAPVPKSVSMLSEAEKQAARRGMHHDVPVFALKGSTS